MQKLITADVTELTAEQAASVNGGGSTQEYGKDAGRALANALTFEPLVRGFEFFTDMYYGV